MAELDDKILNSLDTRLKSLDQTLQSLQKRTEDFANGLKNMGRGDAVKKIAALNSEFVDLGKNASDALNAIKNGLKGTVLSGDLKREFRDLKSKYKELIDNINSSKAKIPILVQGVGATDALNRYNDAQKRIGDQQKKNNGLLKEHNAELDKMLPTLQRLASAFGIAFSIRGLAQFGKKLIETRGEFELQQVALRSILQNKQLADEIWDKTMRAALQSPYTAMQLTRYTKQLAAYRIETEKLFDTTKRLADVSAGLGVDMGRLILAYGQVKAANFLRASEIRQFTEAGVNILGELAQYFSILENRAVSTSDVMERVTKRMVLFSDVEAIFKRMTDEGGMFFNMQEVQANTVKGQIMKLHDAYDQMLNTIGQANQGTLRDMIDALNQMVRNWRDVASFIMKNVNALVILLPLIKTYRIGAQQAAGVTVTWQEAMQYMGVSLKTATTGLKKFSISTAAGTAALKMFLGIVQLTKTALKTFVPFIAIEGLMWLVTKMQSADRAAKELSKTLDNIGSKGAQSLQENIEGFNNLVERLKMATKGSQNYLDIRNKIQSQYGEYLDNLNAESITVENLADSYDRVVERMREKSRQHIMEEGMQEIAKTYGDAMTKFQDEIANFPFTSGLRIDKKEALDVAKLMYELYAKDSKYRGLNNPVSLLRDALEAYYGADAIKGLNYAQLSTGNQFYKSIETRFNKQLELETQANALTQATTKTHEEYVAQLDAEYEHKKKIKEIENDETIQSAERKNFLLQAEELRFAEKKLELQAEYQKKSDSWLDREKKKLQQNFGAFLDAYNAQVGLYIGQRFGDENWMQGDNKEAWTAYNLMIATSDRLSQGQSKWEEHILGEKKLIEENIERIKEKQATQTAADAQAQQALNEELKRETERLELVKKQMELLGLHEKDKSGNNSMYSERIKLLQDMYQKYKLLAKEAYSYAMAEGKVSKSFEDTWSEIMPKGFGATDVPTSYAELASLLQKLETYTPQFDKNGKLTKQFAELMKAIADALSQEDIEISVKIRENFAKEMEQMFSDYELTLELQGLKIPKDAAKDLFDIDYTSLGALSDAIQNFYKTQGVNFDEEDLKLFKQWSKKIDDAIFKEKKSRVKEYSRFLEKEYSDRAKVEMQYAKDVAFVTTNFQGKQRDVLLQNLNTKFENDIAQLNWKSFKESDFYVEMMDDLTAMPVEYTKMLINKLDEILAHPEKLDPKSLKEAIKARERGIDAIAKMSSLEGMRMAKRTIMSAQSDVGGRNWQETRKKVAEELVTTEGDVAKIEKEIKDLTELQSDLIIIEDAIKGVTDAFDGLSTETKTSIGTQWDDASAQIKAYNDELQKLQVRVSDFDKLQEPTPEQKQQNAQDVARIQYLKEEIDLLDSLIRAREAYNTTLSGTSAGVQLMVSRGITSSDVGLRIGGKQQEKAEQNKRITNLKSYLKAFQDFDDSFAKFNAAINSTLNAVQGMGNALYNMFEALGGETDALTEGWKEFGNTMISQITQTLTMIPMMVAAFTAAGIAINSAMGIIGLIAEALQLLFVAIGAIAKLHDSQYEKEIEEQQKRIDELKAAYDRLQKSIEKTWDTMSYIRDYNDMIDSLEQQRDALNKQIAAEEKKKDTDSDKLQGYKDSIQEINDQLEDLKQKQLEVFGGIGEINYRSVAQEFVDAWKDAFLETGDGLQGLKDHFDEFLNEWFVKQATMRIAGRMLEPLFRDIDNAVDESSLGGTSVLLSELQRVREKFATIAPQLSDALEQLAGMWGLGEGEGSLSGLAAGIQGMTEEQANVLEAYWNSVRSYTASIDMNVSRIADMLGAGSRDITNPQLQQLQLIAHNTASIQRMFESVVMSGHTRGQSGIRVFVD